MKVSELGEFGLIDLLAKMLPAPHEPLITGVGDDAAAWRSGAPVQLATTDSLVEDVHFSLRYTGWRELGWKALAVNLSDIAAMGGVPAYALVSLSLPADTVVEDIADMYRGMLELAQLCGVTIAGGDTCRAPAVSVTVAVWGTAANGDILTRSAARPGDKIAVTGPLGGAAAGLEMLRNNLGFAAEEETALREAFLRPAPRLAEGRSLVRMGVRAAIDISDGLVADLKHVCRSSRVSARVSTGDIPVHPAVRACFPGRALEMALSGGEDYELLFTADAGLMKRVRRESSCPVTVIGDMVSGGAGEVTLLDGDGGTLSMPEGGWQHFPSG